MSVVLTQTVVIAILSVIILGQVLRIRILQEDREVERKTLEISLRQTMDLAQQLATIRVSHPGAQPDEISVEKAPPPKPYSQQLWDFLGGIQFEDARTLVEEDIEILRSRGLDDEQIYHKISEGDI